MIEPFASEAGYRDAIDETIRSATLELQIFDGDLSRMMLDDIGRHSLLRQFLSPATTRRLSMVLHDPDRLRTHNPRLLALIRSHGHQIEIRQSPDHLRHLADCFVLADKLGGAIRFHADQARGKLVSGDSVEIHPLWKRFDDLWEVSTPCTPASTAGL